MRLIDVDNFKKFLHNLQDAGAEHVDFDDLHKFLDEHPTTYDVDKVVAELEMKIDNAEFDEMLSKDEKDAYMDAYRRAIEIVNNDRVSDDVCEWELTDTRKVMPYKTSCGNEDLYDYSYKYCPYCGKKIKMVE